MRVNIGFPVVRTDDRSLGVRSRDNQVFWDGKIYLAKCRGSWVVGRGRGSWVWVVGVGVGKCRR